MRRIALFASLALPLATAACGGSPRNSATTFNAASGADKVDAATAGDWVTLDGKVATASPGRFVMNYGSGSITVEVDDWDALNEGALIRPGDRVIVAGRVDGGFFTSRSIEAGSVYDETLNTTFYANPSDEEAFDLARLRYGAGAVPGSIDYTGWVTSVAGKDKRFTLGAGALRIDVDASKLGYDPFDDEGYQKVRAGQRVFVWGDLTMPSGGTPTLVARGVVTLLPSRTTSSAETPSPGPTDTTGNSTLGNTD